MRNKSKKQDKIMLRKCFTKDQLLIMKKYEPLLVYDIPYSLINRGYKRYLKNIDHYVFALGYPTYWFKKDKRNFCFAVKLYIESKKENYDYRIGTTGYSKIEMVKVSGLDKYI